MGSQCRRCVECGAGTTISQMLQFFIPHTKGFCVAQTAKFYPTNCNIPAYNNHYTTLVIASDLVDALRLNAKRKTTIHNAHGPDLKKLADIFGTTTTQNDTTDTREQRVDSSSARNDSPRRQTQDPTPSTATTNKLHIAAQPTVHQKTTHSNTPFVPGIQTKDNKPRRSPRNHTSFFTTNTPANISTDAVYNVLGHAVAANSPCYVTREMKMAREKKK